MGTYIRYLSNKTAYIAGDNTWIEGKALQQLETTANLPNMTHVVGMPDLHPGRGYPVGAAFFSQKQFYPALVGNDIGCGMALWQTDLGCNKIHLDKIEKRLGSIDAPLDSSWDEAIAAFNLSETRFLSALGTIGGGNHFAELQQIETVFDSDAVSLLGLQPKNAVLLVHSGSRGLGEAILRQHIDQFSHHGLTDNTPDAEHYLQRHDSALLFAKANRELIAQRILQRLRIAGNPCLDIHHNFVASAEINGISGWLHRKGATPSDQGAVVIPGSRGDYSYLVEPIQDAETLLSLAHGAGRKWMRSDCKDRLSSRYNIAQLSRTALGSRVICDDRNLIFEEAPEAYKGIDSVVGALQGAGLVKVLARLKPLLTYKTREACCE